MSWQICASRVEQGDPDRFAATMIAPVAVRAKLFPLYALNLELAEAAWASPEPLVCLMRLQFWEDALTAFRDGRMMPAHELTPALADVLEPADIEDWLRLVNWRKRESQRLGFATGGELYAFLGGTSGALMGLAMRQIGGPRHHPAVADVGLAMGCAAWLSALPRLEAIGAKPQPEDNTTPDMIAATGLAALNRARQSDIPKHVRAALWPAFPARHRLTRALSGTVGEDLDPAPLTRTLLLIGTRLSGRI